MTNQCYCCSAWNFMHCCWLKHSTFYLYSTVQHIYSQMGNCCNVGLLWVDLHMWSDELLSNPIWSDSMLYFLTQRDPPTFFREWSDYLFLETQCDPTTCFGEPNVIRLHVLGNQMWSDYMFWGTQCDPITCFGEPNVIRLHVLGNQKWSDYIYWGTQCDPATCF
jgi:hypothetical protein